MIKKNPEVVRRCRHSGDLESLPLTWTWSYLCSRSRGFTVNSDDFETQSAYLCAFYKEFLRGREASQQHISPLRLEPLIHPSPPTLPLRHSQTQHPFLAHLLSCSRARSIGTNTKTRRRLRRTNDTGTSSMRPFDCIELTSMIISTPKHPFQFRYNRLLSLARRSLGRSSLRQHDTAFGMRTVIVAISSPYEQRMCGQPSR